MSNASNASNASNDGHSQWQAGTDPRSNEVFYYHPATLETRSDAPAEYVCNMQSGSDLAFPDIQRVSDSVRADVACWSRKVVLIELQTCPSFAENMGPLIENEGWGFENTGGVQDDIMQGSCTATREKVTLVLWADSARQAELITIGINQARREEPPCSSPA